MILLDTDHCTVLFDERHRLHQHLVSKLAESLHVIGIPIVSIEEQLKGLLSMIHRSHKPVDKVWPYRRLGLPLKGLSEVDIIDFDNDAAQLAHSLKEQKLSIGNQDIAIAAITITNDSMLLTANERDFRRIPDLHFENWLG